MCLQTILFINNKTKIKNIKCVLLHTAKLDFNKLRKMNITNFKVGSSYAVDVTHINDPHSFYVRSASVRDEMDAIEKPNKLLSAEMLTIGQRVAYKSNLLKKFVRGSICYKSTDGKDCDLFAVDYGFYEKSIMLDDIYSNKNEYPALAMHCSLYLCEATSDGFTEDVIDAMKEFVGNDTATVTVRSILNDKFIVELRTSDCPGDVATMMGLLNYTTLLPKHSNTVHRFYNSIAPPKSAASALNLTRLLCYKHRDLQVGDAFHVRVQSGSSLSSFYVAETNEYKKLVRGQSSLSAYCKDHQMQDHEIVPGRHCAVSVDNPPIYERAIIKEISEPNCKAVLQLVDWGKEIEANFSCIKSVKSEMYFSQPIIAMHCSTDNVPWKTGLPNFLFPGHSFFIEIKEVGNFADQPHKVNIYK